MKRLDERTVANDSSGVQPDVTIVINMRDVIVDELPWWRMADLPKSTSTPRRRALFVLAAAALAILLATSGYLVATRIAAARATVARLDRIAAAREADVATLRQDFEIRSRMSQLDRWGIRLDLAPPQADQFATDSRAIAPVAAARRQNLDAIEVEDARRTLSAPRPAYPQAARAKLDTLIDRIAP